MWIKESEQIKSTIASLRMSTKINNSYRGWAKYSRHVLMRMTAKNDDIHEIGEKTVVTSIKASLS